MVILFLVNKIIILLYFLGIHKLLLKHDCYYMVHRIVTIIPCTCKVMNNLHYTRAPLSPLVQPWKEIMMQILHVYLLEDLYNNGIRSEQSLCPHLHFVTFTDIVTPFSKSAMHSAVQSHDYMHSLSFDRFCCPSVITSTCGLWSYSNHLLKGLEF